MVIGIWIVHYFICISFPFFMIINKENDPLERDLYKQSYSARRRIIRTIILNEIFLNEICVNKREWHFV